MLHHQRSRFIVCVATAALVVAGSTNAATSFAQATAVSDETSSNAETLSADLKPPVRLQADGEPIDIGKLSRYAHAGPWIADVDCDGDRDLLVGDFPGYFWYFENTNNDQSPEYTSNGKFQAGEEDAVTPVY